MTIFLWLLLYTSAVSLYGSFVYRNRSAHIKSTYTRTMEYKNISLFMAIMTFAFLIVIVGCRSYYNDTVSYKVVFDRAITGDLSQVHEYWLRDDKAKYFYILQCFFKRFISKDYTVWFFALGIFEIGAVIKFFYKFSDSYFWSSYLYITSATFTWLMSGVRQYFAVCIVLYGVDLLFERKTVKFIILVLFASLFHFSALIWIPIYFICVVKPWSWRIYVFVVAVFLILFSLDNFTNILNELLEDTNYSNITDNFSTENGMGAIRMLVSAVPCALAFICKRKIEDENNQIINISVNISVVILCINMVATVTSGITIGRLPGYFMTFNLILIPFILNKGFSHIIRPFLKIGCASLYFLYFYYNFFVLSSNLYGSELLNILY